MAMWRLAQLLSLALAAVQALDLNNSTLSAGSIRRLAGSPPGNIAVCYTPFHNAEYPLFGGAVDANRLIAAIENDFSLLSKYVTHVRTYHAMHYDIEIAPIAAKYGLKLYLGVFMTPESWQAKEISVAVNAIKQYSSTVEAVLVGNENLIDFKQTSGVILNMVAEIKRQAGPDAWRVKYGTVQRITEYLDDRFNGEAWNLYYNLDILGVNIYPFFDGNYDYNRPADLLDTLWNKVTAKFPGKMRLTETGFPTAGGPASKAVPSVENSYNYYESVVNWNPSNYQGMPKFWFQAFDRRVGDPANFADYERFFGFFTTEKNAKRDNFPRPIGSSSQCVIEEGVDYSGNDVGSAAASRAEDCFAKCNSYDGCGAFTWSSFNGGTCWLKSSKGSTSVNSDARSAITCQCNLGGLERDVDYSGNDIGSAQSSNPEACISICQGTAGCRAFTWTPFNSGTCWLKWGKGSTAVASGVTSGVIC